MIQKAGSLRILVTDAHQLAGLGAVRSLGRAGHTVVAGFPQGPEHHPSIWSRYCSGHVYYPDPRYCLFAFKDWLRDQAHRRTLDAVLPITESAVAGVASIRKELPSELLTLLPSDPALVCTLSKFHSTRLALALGISCPTTVFISDGTQGGQWNEDFTELKYPIIIKTDNYETREGSYEPGRRFIAANARDAHTILRNLQHLGTRVIAQEVIPGSGTGAFFLRFAGTTYLRFAHRRLHEVPYTGGASSFRESCHDNELVSLGERLLDAIGYDGVAMVEFRRGARDGKLYFLEINGRLWGSLALALHSGIDFPKALVECYQYGQPTTTTSNYRSGIKCRNIFPRELGYLVSVLRARAANGADPPPSKVWAVVEFFALSLNPTVKHDWFWWSDPIPGILQAWAMVTWCAKKTLHKGLQQMQRDREKRLLESYRTKHHHRRGQARYFDRPLNQILFQCYGNIIRSPIAAYYWNSQIGRLPSQRPIGFSAGFHPYGGRKSPAWIVDLAAEHNIDLTSHYSSVLDAKDVESADAIFVMDRKNYQYLLDRYSWASDKTYFLGLFSGDDQIEIADPYNMSIEDARVCLQHLFSSLDGLMTTVLRN